MLNSIQQSASETETFHVNPQLIDELIYVASALKHVEERAKVKYKSLQPIHLHFLKETGHQLSTFIITVEDEKIPLCTCPMIGEATYVVWIASIFTRLGWFKSALAPEPLTCGSCLAQGVQSFYAPFN